jgi:hypothetical protein
MRSHPNQLSFTVQHDFPDRLSGFSPLVMLKQVERLNHQRF